VVVVAAGYKMQLVHQELVIPVVAVAVVDEEADNLVSLGEQVALGLQLLDSHLLIQRQLHQVLMTFE
jgi:hypothetical protein